VASSGSLFAISPARQTPTASRARIPGMDMSKMTTEELQALLKMLAEMERQEMALLMQ